MKRGKVLAHSKVSLTNFLSLVTYGPVAPFLGVQRRRRVLPDVGGAITIVRGLGKGSGAKGREGEEGREGAHGFDC